VKSYRPQSGRTLYVSGDIDARLIERLLPDITRLREDGGDITLNIDSNGGSVYHADLLFALLTQPDLDGRQRELLTITAHRANSAAAILLTRGTYAIAYPTAEILFHGLRRTEALVTTETAAQLATALQNRNEGYALTLADSSIVRFLWLVNNAKGALPPFGSDDFTAEFAHYLASKISKKSADLVNRAHAKCREIKQLSSSVLPRVRFKKSSTTGEMDVALIKKILDYEVKTKPKSWTLSGEGFNQLRSDFTQLIDYHLGAHRRLFSGKVLTLLQNLLSDEERLKLESFQPDKEVERAAWLKTNLEPKAMSLWYFVLSLCRLLYEGENDFSVEEAYWLGQIDEVAGSDLPCLRILTEAVADSKAIPPPTSD